MFDESARLIRSARTETHAAAKPITHMGVVSYFSGSVVPPISGRRHVCDACDVRVNKTCVGKHAGEIFVRAEERLWRRRAPLYAEILRCDVRWQRLDAPLCLPTRTKKETSTPAQRRRRRAHKLSATCRSGANRTSRLVGVVV